MTTNVPQKANMGEQMQVRNEPTNFTPLMLEAADCIRRAWAGADLGTTRGAELAEKADDDLAALDAKITNAGYDIFELISVAREWALQSYRTATA
jgi:hypothetical protein